MKQILQTVACSMLLMAAAAAALSQEDLPNPVEATAQPSASKQAAPSDVPPSVAPQTAEQLDALVAPIALYPDALVAQVLAACAYPEQVTFADDWLSQNKNLTGTALSQSVNQQPWDPSVKALTQFPSVLHELARNLSWTSSLGQAFTNQQADVMAAVQAMRAKAKAAGTLQSSSQITVVQQSPSTIVIKPANPEVIYVPQYNPTVVFGAPVVVPLWLPPPMPVYRAGIYFGSGITIGATYGWGGGWGWGWHAWNVNWRGGWGGGGTVIYNNNTYINRTVINRTTYNNYRPWGPNNGSGYHPSSPSQFGGGGYHPTGTYGPSNGFHPGTPGANSGYQPSGGFNGYHGMTGSGSGLEPTGGFGQDRSVGFERMNQPRSYMSGFGNGARAESSRGWGSMRSSGFSGMRSSGMGAMRGGGRWR